MILTVPPRIRLSYMGLFCHRHGMQFDPLSPRGVIATTANIRTIQNSAQDSVTRVTGARESGTGRLASAADCAMQHRAASRSMRS